MLDAYDSLTKALMTFFEATPRGETEKRLSSEVYMAEALLARPRILSSCELGGSLAEHGFMKVRPRFSYVATKKANTRGAASVFVLNHRELRR